MSEERDELKTQTAMWLAAAANEPPAIDTALEVVSIRWQMVHARELRQIRESLARLEAALADSQATGAEK